MRTLTPSLSLLVLSVAGVAHAQQPAQQPETTTTAAPAAATTPPAATTTVGATPAPAPVVDSPKAVSDPRTESPAVIPKDGPTAPAVAAGAGGAAGAGVPVVSSNNGFMDTRLTWTFGDDDFLHNTGELIPLSPNASIGDRQQYRLFYDGLNSRFAGRENLTHLAMYKKLPGFIEGVTTEASLVLRFDMSALSANTGNLNTALYDSGSFLRIFYNTNTKNAKEGISATFFPLDTDRVRLGYLYEISWGGTAGWLGESIFPRNQGASPGLKVQYDRKGFYAYGAFKTSTIVQPQQLLSGGTGAEGDVETIRVGETNYGFLAGTGVDVTEKFRVDAGAGYFMQGKFDLEDVRGKPVYTYGGSMRALYHEKMPVPASIDLTLYRNDPMAPMIMFRPETYVPGQVSYAVSAEATVLQQNLKDFEVTGATKKQTAYAGALQAVVKADYLSLSVTGIVRNLEFIEKNVPGYIPFSTLPQFSETTPELFGSFAASYFLKDAHLTPNFGIGVQMPSTYRTEFTEGGTPASRTIVVRRAGQESILPYSADAQPIVQSRIGIRWDLNDAFAMLGWAQLVYDANGSLVVRDPSEGTASLRVSQSASRLGAAMALQARF